MRDVDLAERLLDLTQQTKLSINFDQLVDTMPVTPEGRAIASNSGVGQVVIDQPKLLVFWWTMDPGNDMPFHWHTAPESILVAEGAMDLHLGDGNNVRLHRGQAHCLLPYERHAASSQAGSSYFVAFHGSNRPTLQQVDV